MNKADIQVLSLEWYIKLSHWFGNMNVWGWEVMLHENIHSHIWEYILMHIYLSLFICNNIFMNLSMKIFISTSSTWCHLYQETTSLLASTSILARNIPKEHRNVGGRIPTASGACKSLVRQAQMQIPDLELHSSEWHKNNIRNYSTQICWWLNFSSDLYWWGEISDLFSSPLFYLFCRGYSYCVFPWQLSFTYKNENSSNFHLPLLPRTRCYLSLNEAFKKDTIVIEPVFSKDSKCLWDFCIINQCTNDSIKPVQLWFE